MRQPPAPAACLPAAAGHATAHRRRASLTVPPFAGPRARGPPSTASAPAPPYCTRTRQRHLHPHPPRPVRYHVRHRRRVARGDATGCGRATGEGSGGRHGTSAGRLQRSRPRMAVGPAGLSRAALSRQKPLAVARRPPTDRPPCAGSARLTPRRDPDRAPAGSSCSR